MAAAPTRDTLPTNVVPSRYDVTIRPDLSAFTFHGDVVMHAKILSPTSVIMLNTVDITITKAEVRASPTAEPVAAVVSYDTEQERAILTVAAPVAAGSIVVHVEYDGILGDNLKGFYRSKVTRNGQETYIAATQFEPTDCRRAVPCYDQPGSKAVWAVTLDVPADLLALSNMPVRSETDLGSGLKRVCFDDTPVMSSYLLAFVVGQFDFVEARTPDGVLVRCYTDPGKSEQGRFALDVAVKTLPFYNAYFETPYPLPKLDMIAIADFAAGAMENWGLVTYREVCLLVDPKQSSSKVIEFVAIVVAHELAHQWFGNLVTMEWWEGLWLNEGFASWVEYLCVDHLFPQWNMWPKFVSSDMMHAMELDALRSTHPVEVLVGRAADVDEIFDTISYMKGCTVIRLCQSWMGAENFRKGLALYLKRHQYANAATADLWKALADASGLPVASVMSTWIDQPGYPYVVVEENEAVGGKRVFTLTQRRYLAIKDEAVKTDDSLWAIPLTVKSADGNIVHSSLFSTRTATIEIAAPASAWLKFNSEQTSMIRVAYPAAMFHQLGSAVASKQLGEIDRVGLIADAFALAAVGDLPLALPLDLLMHYRADDAYPSWSSICSSLADLDLIAANGGDLVAFDAFVCATFKEVGAFVGWAPRDGEPNGVTQLRPLVLGWLAAHGDEATYEAARALFPGLLADVSTVPADLRGVVMRAVLRRGGVAEFDQLLELYRKLERVEEKERVLSVLSATQDPSLLRRACEFGFSSEVRLQDSYRALVGVAASHKGCAIAWAYITENWARIAKAYDGGFLLTRIIKAASGFASEAHAQEVETFFRAQATPGIERTVSQTVEAIRANASRVARDLEPLRAWLRAAGF